MLHKYCRYVPLFSDNKRCDCKSNQIPQIQLHLLKGYIRRGHQSLSKSHEIRTKARRHKETICLQEALNWYSNGATGPKDWGTLSFILQVFSAYLLFMLN